jgi:nucleoside-diphosphate-sugar epimerase
MDVVTGAAGFVGSRLVSRLAKEGVEVVALARSAAPAGLPGNVRWVVCDLLEPATYESSIAGAGIVFHLAGITGKAPPREYQRNNVEVTEALLGVCERGGVGRFVFASSVAATFADRRFYPYAESKISAEAAVRAASLATTIVRPTMIFGDGSPIQASLTRLARLPVTPVFGDGRTRVQPIDVNDVVRLLVAAGRDPSAVNAVIDIGGPRILSMDELIRELKALDGGGAARLFHLPLGLLRWTLAALESIGLLPVLPFTAGQLTSFANDGVAPSSELAGRLLPAPVNVPAR